MGHEYKKITAHITITYSIIKGIRIYVNKWRLAQTQSLLSNLMQHVSELYEKSLSVKVCEQMMMHTMKGCNHFVLVG